MFLVAQEGAVVSRIEVNIEVIKLQVFSSRETDLVNIILYIERVSRHLKEKYYDLKTLELINKKNLI